MIDGERGALGGVWGAAQPTLRNRNRSLPHGCSIIRSQRLSSAEATRYAGLG